MNTASQYFYLLRWLVFPNVLCTILILLPSGGVSLWLYLTDQVQFGKLFYPLAVVLYTLIMIAFFARFPLLFARKTMTLTGVLAWRLTVIGFALISLTSLVYAPAMLGINNLASWSNWLRAAILMHSFVTLLLYIGALTRLNWILLYFGMAGLMMWDGEALSAIATSAWREGSSVAYGALFLLTLALWAALYLRIARGRMPRPLSGAVDIGNRSGEQPSPLEQRLVSRLKPTLRLSDTIKNPGRILLLEASRPVLAFTLVKLFIGIPIGLFFGLIFYTTGSNDFAWAPTLAAFVVLVPLFLQLISVDTVAGNVRRLWLLTPGGRREILQQLERSFFTSACISMLPFLVVSVVLLLMIDRPLWWIACWAALIPLVLLLISYLQLWTVIWDNFREMLTRILLTFLIIGLGIVFWGSSQPLFGGALIALISVCVLLFRHLARQRWSRMDYALLRNKVGRV